MARSTSRASQPEAGSAPLAALDRFYAFHAPIYDLTRPFILFGRSELLAGLEVTAGCTVLDVGCGTGWSFPALLAAGARILGAEPCAPMRRKAADRLRRLGAEDRVSLEAQPYGSATTASRGVDRILFSYSLSMMRPFEPALTRAVADLAPSGRIGVVDFLDAPGPVALWLAANHVELGEERLSALRTSFPRHAVRIHRTGLWRYYLFWGRVA